MLSPEDWQNYLWRVRTLPPPGAPTTYERYEERVWRITATAGAGGGSFRFLNELNAPAEVGCTLLANQTIVLEPKGMVPLALVYVGLASIVVETIRKT